MLKQYVSQNKKNAISLIKITLRKDIHLLLELVHKFGRSDCSYIAYVCSCKILSPDSSMKSNLLLEECDTFFSSVHTVIYCMYFVVIHRTK